MQPFRNFGESDDPWFRVGQLAVTTTVMVSAMSVAYMFVWAFEGFSRPITTRLILNSGTSLGSAGEGQIWRLVTWPIPTEPSLWTLLLVAVFWMLGSQLEALMGRKRFTFFLLVLTIVPALVMTALEFTDTFGVVYGLRYVELGVLIAFATLPARLTGHPHRRPPRPQHRRPQPRSTHLSSVPPPPPAPPADVAAQARIDALLDKMGEHGLESLTEAERRTLEDLSKRLRDRRDRS